MVLLNNDNQLNIKNYHMFQCIEKRKNEKVTVSPLKDNNIDLDIDVINFNKYLLKNTNHGSTNPQKPKTPVTK